MTRLFIALLPVVIRTIDLPRVHEIRIMGRETDEIYAFGDGGRIIRLLAR